MGRHARGIARRRPRRTSVGRRRGGSEDAWLARRRSNPSGIELWAPLFVNRLVAAFFEPSSRTRH